MSGEFAKFEQYQGRGLGEWLIQIWDSVARPVQGIDSVLRLAIIDCWSSDASHIDFQFLDICRDSHHNSNLTFRPIDL